LGAAARLGALTLEVLHARHLPFQKLVSARWWRVPGMPPAWPYWML
jgi:hypothetical protein